MGPRHDPEPSTEVPNPTTVVATSPSASQLPPTTSAAGEDTAATADSSNTSTDDAVHHSRDSFFRRARNGLRELTTSRSRDNSRGSSSANSARQSSTATSQKTTAKLSNNTFYWPAHLPEACSRARVLVYGYDADVVKFFDGATNKNSFYDHAGDLLGYLTRERVDAVCCTPSRDLEVAD